MACDSRFQGLAILYLALNCVAVALAQAPTETVLHSFQNPPNGARPSGVPIVDSAGNLYGTASMGGAANAGTVYRVSPADVQTLLYSFTGGLDGDGPNGVIRDSAGNLYGTTTFGGLLNGINGSGVVFELDAAGKETVLYSFTGKADGGNPYAGVIRDSAGNLYGTAAFGGLVAGNGVVYKVDPSGNETVLYSFQGYPDGYDPTTGVIRDPAGNLYGTTLYGGTADCGTIYKIDTSGQETILYQFPCAFDGASSPVPGPLIRDSSGDLYGATRNGGSFNAGSVYELDATGQATVLYSFTGGADGANPQIVVRDSAGNLYGTTYGGGSSISTCQPYGGCGVVYELDSAGQLSVLYTFTGGPNGSEPGGLSRDPAGNLYGTTPGGILSLGTVWEVAAGGQYTQLSHFVGPTDGTSPLAGLLRDSAGNLYGTTELGGPANAGVVYKISASGQETILYSFKGAPDGANPSGPYGGVIQDSAGNLYGTTSSGGAASLGMVYKLDAGGQETVLHSFTGSPDGSAPLAGVILDAAGNLYGTTSAGGMFNYGTVFKLDASGHETILHNFRSDPDGATPHAGVIRDASGNLYGTTLLGGFFNSGIVYELDAAGKETVLHTFQGADGGDGSFPDAGVVRDEAGNLYGTTSNGGTLDANAGTVYEIDAAGNETVLYAFASEASGLDPTAGLILDAAGNLYGTAAGGVLRNGVVFELSPTGTETVLHAFTGRDGSGPYSGVVRDSAGNLYGTTTGGGAERAGVVYKIAP